jgi:hypothetical protein
MPCLKHFDGYVEQAIRVLSTSLIHFERNRYNVPTAFAHSVVRLHFCPAELALVAGDQVIARNIRQLDRYVTI